MSDNIFTTTYLQKQETFLVDVIRRCVEAESKLAVIQKEHLDLQQKHNSVTDQLTQVLVGLEATTSDRDKYRDEHSKYRDEILALGDLKEKCDKIEKNYEEHMKNYNLVNEAYQKLQIEYQALLDLQKNQSAEKKVNKVVKLEQQPKKDDWS